MSSSVIKSKGSIRFTFKESLKSLKEEPNKQSLIMLQFAYGRQFRMKSSTGFYSCYNDWDSNKQQVRNKAHILNKDYVNNTLNDIKNQLLTEVSKLNGDNISVTKKLIKDKIYQISKPEISTEREEMTFYKFVDLFCNRKKGKIAEVTLRSYKQTLRLLKECNAQIDFDDIDMNFYYDFIRFLEEDDKSVNTIGKHIKNLKSFLNSATDDGHNKTLKYKNREFKAPKELTTAIYLTDNEISDMRDLDLKKHPEYDLARDIFFIGCAIGQRVSDYNGLTNNQFYHSEGIDFFRIRQSKTKNIVHCPITKSIKKIMEKYDNCPPPKMSSQDLNDHIKEVARRAGIDETIECNFTKGGKAITENKFKHELVCTHTARRSFCTNMYKKGMPIYEIMIFSGHTTEKEFYKYIRIEKEQQALKIAKSGHFDI